MLNTALSPWSLRTARMRYELGMGFGPNYICVEDSILPVCGAVVNSSLVDTFKPQGYKLRGKRFMGNNKHDKCLS